MSEATQSTKMATHYAELEWEEGDCCRLTLKCTFDPADSDRPCRYADDEGKLTNETGCSIQDFWDEGAAEIRYDFPDVVLDVVEWENDHPTLRQSKRSPSIPVERIKEVLAAVNAEYPNHIFGDDVALAISDIKHQLGLDKEAK